MEFAIRVLVISRDVGAIPVVSGVVQVAPVDIVENLRVRSDCRQVSTCAKGCWCDTSSHNVVNRWGGIN